MPNSTPMNTNSCHSVRRSGGPRTGRTGAGPAEAAPQAASTNGRPRIRNGASRRPVPIGGGLCRGSAPYLGKRDRDPLASQPASKQRRHSPHVMRQDCQRQYIRLFAARDPSVHFLSTSPILPIHEPTIPLEQHYLRIAVRSLIPYDSPRSPCDSDEIAKLLSPRDHSFPPAATLSLLLV